MSLGTHRMLREESSLRMVTRTFQEKSRPLLTPHLVQQSRHTCKCVHSYSSIRSVQSINLPLQNNIFDIFNSFAIEMSVDAPLRDIPPGNGDEVPLDFSGMPTLTVTGASQVQVQPLPYHD